MTVCSPNRLIHKMRCLAGRILACGRLHRIRTAWVDGSQVVMKSRRFGSGAVIPIGNLYLLHQRSDVEVLTDKAWLRWELAVDRATRFDRVLQSHPSPHDQFRGLITRRCPGRPLTEILADAACPLDQKLTAIGWAIDSLYELHRRRADWGNGIAQSISHGDATSNNVIVNFESKSACWIDFDTRHLPHLPEIDRHSDDLRALLFSSAACLTKSCYPRLAAEFIASKPARLLVDRFRQRLTSDWLRLNTVQLAQSPLSWTDVNAMAEALLKSLSNTKPTCNSIGQLHSSNSRTEVEFFKQSQ
jgi:hypothetical protein